MRVVTVILVLLTGVHLVAQTDRPVSSEDLADKLTAEKAKHQRQIDVLIPVREYLYVLAESGKSSDPKTMVPVVHADLLICLATGDLHRSEVELYKAAAEAAGHIAKDWEKKATGTGVAPSAESEETFTRQLNDLENRAQQLKAQSEPTEEEVTELQALDSRRSQLRAALSLFAQLRAAASEPSKFVTAAKQMRAQERTFVLKAQDAGLLATLANIQCVSGVLTLKELSAREGLQAELARWSATQSDSARTSSPTQPLAPAIDEVGKLMNYAKEVAASLGRIDQFVHDPAQLRKQLERQEAIIKP